MADDWFRFCAGTYYHGARRQITKRSREAARRIGQERAGWYYRRFYVNRQVTKGPFPTLRAAKKGAK